MVLNIFLVCFWLILVFKLLILVIMVVNIWLNIKFKVLVINK